ncbi:MAG: hypothetical protein CMP23_06000 [Rickettsiales bacterium]|nr:hypothetical protein [Rickettsiales bacterium]
MRTEAELTDRGLLRWACREALTCVVSLPGREIWGRSFFVDLREGGPRPQLVIAQPGDLERGDRARALRSGDSVRIWSVRDGRPWHLQGFVVGSRVMEGRDTGPVEAALVQLPYRLSESDLRIESRHSLGAPRAVIRLERGDPGRLQSLTLLETWLDQQGNWLERGGGHLIDLSRRSFSYSCPDTSGLVLMPGAELVLEFRLPDLQLRTRVAASVRAAHELGGQLFQGLSLGRCHESISDEEHRETLRLISACLR